MSLCRGLGYWALSYLPNLSTSESILGSRGVVHKFKRVALVACFVGRSELKIVERRQRVEELLHTLSHPLIRQAPEPCAHVIDEMLGV